MKYQDKAIARFTDAYSKSKSSANYKLLATVMPEFDELLVAIRDVCKSIDMDFAFGQTLTNIAKNVNQERGNVNDDVLRVLMKAKIAGDMSDGTVDTLLSVVSFIFGGDEAADQAQVFEMFNDPINPEPAAVRIIAPIDTILSVDITVNQFIQLMLRVKAGGVGIYADLLGTFEFGTEEQYGPEYETGFADDEQTVGGTLSALFEPEDSTPLPI